MLSLSVTSNAHRAKTLYSVPTPTDRRGPGHRPQRCTHSHRPPLFTRSHCPQHLILIRNQPDRYVELMVNLFVDVGKNIDVLSEVQLSYGWAELKATNGDP